MKIFPAILIVFQLTELICYVNLYIYIVEHSKQMMMADVITKETFIKRKRKKTFSLFAQFLGFTVEMLYLIFHFLAKFIGMHYIDYSFLEFANAFKTTEFCVITTVEIMATTEMRHKLFSLFKKN